MAEESQDPLVDASAVWIGRRQHDHGTLGPGTYRVLDAHATKGLRQWLYRMRKVPGGKYLRYPNERLWNDVGLTPLKGRSASHAWAKP